MKDFDLKHELEKKKITVYRLSKDVGIASSNIQEVCVGKRKFENFSLKNAMKILRYLYSEHDLLEVIRSYF